MRRIVLTLAMIRKDGADPSAMEVRALRQTLAPILLDSLAGLPYLAVLDIVVEGEPAANEQPDAPTTAADMIDCPEPGPEVLVSARGLARPTETDR